MLAVAPEGPALAAVKYRAWLTLQRRARDKPVAPPRTGGPFDSAILIADYLLGRLEDLPESEGSALGAGRGDAVADRDAAARGQTQRAIELYEEAMRSLSVPHSRMLPSSSARSCWSTPAAATRPAPRSPRVAALAQADGSLSPLALNSFAEAKLALRLEKDPALARAVLDRAESVPRRPPDRLGGRDVRHAVRPGPAPAGPRRARAGAAARGGGGDAGGRPHPGAADRGGLPGRGRVARRQRGRRRSRRRHRARRRPPAGLQPHPHAGARRLAGGALAPHRRRAERGLDRGTSSAAR